MRRSLAAVTWKLLMVGMSWHLLQTGCVRDLQREMEVLFAPEANSTLLYDSWVFNRLGPDFLAFFTRFW